MPIYDVTAVALDGGTGEHVARPVVERIDTEANMLFAECTSEGEVHDQYEEFWDAFKGCCSCGCAQKTVKVLTVKRVS